MRLNKCRKSCETGGRRHVFTQPERNDYDRPHDVGIRLLLDASGNLPDFRPQRLLGTSTQHIATTAAQECKCLNARPASECDIITAGRPLGIEESTEGTGV